MDVYIKILKLWNGLKVGGLTLEKTKKRRKVINTLRTRRNSARNRENIKKWFGNAWDGVKT